MNVKRALRLGGTLWMGAFVAVSAVVFYLELKSSSRIYGVWFIPPRWAWWLESHDFSKNMLGFGTWAFAGVMAVPNDPSRLPRWGRCLAHPWAVPAGLFLAVVLMELVQLWLPHRCCDRRDILAGGFAVSLAWALATPLRRWLGESAADSPTPSSSPDAEVK